MWSVASLNVYVKTATPFVGAAVTTTAMPCFSSGQRARNSRRAMRGSVSMYTLMPAAWAFSLIACAAASVSLSPSSGLQRNVSVTQL